MRLRIRLPQVLLGVALAALGALAAALVSQHVYGMLPCAWCVLQRLLYLMIAAFALLAWLAGRLSQGLRALRPTSIALAWLAGAAGIAAALWQQLYAANSFSCDRTLAERIVSGLGLDSLSPGVFMPLASCADAAVHLLGIPYAVWSLALFTLLSLALGAALRTSWRAGFKTTPPPAAP